jgi:hypothetical protein
MLAGWTRVRVALAGQKERRRSSAGWCINTRKRAWKRRTPGVSTLGVACQLLGRRIRSRSSGSPSETLRELLSGESRVLLFSNSLALLILRRIGCQCWKKFESRSGSECNTPRSAPCKGAESLRVQVPPGNWVAPAGSNRSGSGGNETAEAFGARGRLGRPREQTGRNVRER